MIIEVNVSNKIAKLKNKDAFAVCGNSDFVIRFSFDEEWSSYTTKTARFKYNGSYTDVVFNGADCNMPVISGTYSVEIGVFAGNLHTTTPAILPMKKSILCGGGTPVAPTPDVYSQIMVLLNETMESVEEDADRAEDAADDAEGSATAASASAQAAAGSASSAAGSASAASSSASAAAGSAGSASQSATAASGSASNAATSEGNAAESASDAATSANDAEDAKDAATAAKTAAQTAQQAAETASANASTSATNAAASEQNAETAESNAQTAQQAAETAQGLAVAAKDVAVTAKNQAVAAKDDAVAAKNAALVAVNHYPTISENGNWLVWDALSGDWVDTGIPATGDDGKSAYQSAQDGGYTGTEAQFNTDLETVGRKLTAPIVVTQSAPTSIALDDNKEYYLTDVSDLTLTYPVGNFECYLKITTVASGTVSVVIPTSTYIWYAPTFSNGETWEMSIKNGVVVAGKAVSA